MSAPGRESTTGVPEKAAPRQPEEREDEKKRGGGAEDVDGERELRHAWRQQQAMDGIPPDRTIPDPHPHPCPPARRSHRLIGGSQGAPDEPRHALPFAPGCGQHDRDRDQHERQAEDNNRQAQANGQHQRQNHEPGQLEGAATTREDHRA